MPKGTSKAEMVLNSEKIKLLALAIILSGSISQSVRQAVNRKFY